MGSHFLFDILEVLLQAVIDESKVRDNGACVPFRIREVCVMQSSLDLDAARSNAAHCLVGYEPRQAEKCASRVANREGFRHRWSVFPIDPKKSGFSVFVFSLRVPHSISKKPTFRFGTSGTG